MRFARDHAFRTQGAATDMVVGGQQGLGQMEGCRGRTVEELRRQGDLDAEANLEDE
jgi:hypothetical protein